MSKTRILLVDDHTAMLVTVTRLLEDTCQIVGSVTNGQAAIEVAIKQFPDVILMDISLPVMNGIEAADRIIRMGTQTKIIFLTVHDDLDFVRAALATGASGYVFKSHMATDLVPAIREALAGHRFVSPCLLAKDTSTP